MLSKLARLYVVHSKKQALLLAGALGHFAHAVFFCDIVSQIPLTKVGVLQDSHYLFLTPYKIFE
jgi:hypothetical protein